MQNTPKRKNVFWMREIEDEGHFSDSDKKSSSSSSDSSKKDSVRSEDKELHEVREKLKKDFTDYDNELWSKLDREALERIKRMESTIDDIISSNKYAALSIENIKHNGQPVINLQPPIENVTKHTQRIVTAYVNDRKNLTKAEKKAVGRHFLDK